MVPAAFPVGRAGWQFGSWRQPGGQDNPDRSGAARTARSENYPPLALRGYAANTARGQSARATKVPDSAQRLWGGDVTWPMLCSSCMRTDSFSTLEAIPPRSGELVKEGALYKRGHKRKVRRGSGHPSRAAEAGWLTSLHGNWPELESALL